MEILDTYIIIHYFVSCIVSNGHNDCPEVALLSRVS